MNPNDVPMSSGLYIVTIDADVPVPIDRDPRRPNCLKVTRHHCKFGRAKNLRARCKNYMRVFEGHVVSFKVISIVDDIVAAETACIAQLAKYRVRGQKGRHHEWLVNITSDEVAAIVRNTLVRSGFLRPAASSGET